MEISVLKALLDSISRFSLLPSCDNIKSEPVQKYHQKINEMLKLLQPVIDEIVESEVASDEELNKLLAELDTIVSEASELVKSWHQMMSKVYFVMQNESLIAKIQTSGLEICQLLNSLLQDYDNDSNLSACIEHCRQKIPLIGYGQTSNVIKEAIRNLMENTFPSSENLVMIADSLSLSSNRELLMEAVALEKVKSKTDHDENNEEVKYIDHMIALITHMHNCLVKIKQSQIVNGIPISADFCCPLSLELMSDPVIVASGQTYERAFIRKWLDQGLNVCPKTRQTLGHTNLIPNYTVKALIANWCELNSVKLPDPLKSMSLNQPSALLAHADKGAGNSFILQHTNHASRTNHSRSPESTRSASNGTHLDAHLNDEPMSPHLHTATEGALVSRLISGSPLHVGNGFEVAGISRISSLSSEDRESNLEEITVGSGDQTLMPSSIIDEQCQVINRSASISSAVSSINYLRGAGNANEITRVSSDLTHYNSGASGEVISDAPASSSPHGDSKFPSRLAEVQSRSQTIWRRPSERFVPRIVSSPATDTGPDLSGIEAQVRKLVEDLQSHLVDVQKLAASELRFLAKHSTENRIMIANCGAINSLVGLLNSTDVEIQENAVTALLNLSINDNNKTAIVNAEAIYPLIHVLETGSPEAKENSAATLFSLSVIEENKVRIGRSGAIRPLVDLLANGTPRGKKDAATALFNLSIFHENKGRIVQAGAVKCLVELMDPAAGMVDKAVAVLSNLATIPEGRTAIGQARGIPVLVEVVELGSSRGKENAAAALLQLCTNNNRFCNMVLQEGAVPPLVALSQSGTPRAKEKAQTLLNYFRNQRHNNGGGRG